MSGNQRQTIVVPRDVFVSDAELMQELQDGVETIDLNSQRNSVKPTTWHVN